mgnify:CR=1 FL=1
MNYTEAIKYTETRMWKNGFNGFDRMKKVLAHLGDPQKQLRFIHVAGSNGKGSTCAMVSSVLRCAGYTTGLFISPHLIKYNERISVNGTDISDDDFALGVTLIKEACETTGCELTIFERLTILCFWYCARMHADFVVLEVGLGGRCDSTNVIDAPEVSVIANMALEHTEILGDTLEKITAEKAEIIKEGCPVVMMHQDEGAMQVVRAKAAAMHAPLTETAPGEETLVSATLGLQVIDYRSRKNVKLGLFGEYQYRNSALALDVIDVLIKKGYSISEEAIYEGMEQVSWPGRFQMLCQSPMILLDGAHNPDGAQVLKTSLETYFPGRKFRFMMGVMADKHYEEMLQIITPLAESFTCVAVEDARALDSDSLAALIRQNYGIPARDAGSVAQGLELELADQTKDQILVIFGSLYQAGDVLHYFKEHGLMA